MRLRLPRHLRRLGATGRAISPIPDSDEVAVVEFLDGAPRGEFVLFLPCDDVACCGNAYEQWCPNSNLFRTAADAAVWTAKHRRAGAVLSLQEAAQRGGARWGRLVPARAHKAQGGGDARPTRALPS